jgi:hypothetical protein
MYQRQFFKYDFDKELTQQVIKENTVRWIC